MKTCQHTLSDTFALRLQEFMFLIGKRTLTLPQARYVFNNIFDTDANKLVDKFEIICGIILLSALSSEEKVEFMYDLFDFNSKGYVVETEVILMLRTITKCADKIDSNMGAPPDDRIREIARDSIAFGVMHPGSLRKYELIQFAANYPTARAFLESWRGHASQVLLASHQKWQDQSFPAQHISIAPSPSWLTIGLPPGDFVHWKRRERVAMGCKLLFGHADKFVKGSDRVFMEGVGCMAQGTLKQGLLADRWILNGIAVIISVPHMVKFVFATTGQEEVGRFCVRLFEGRGWLSVFLDDRIPCNPLRWPLFMRSSCDSECWPLILEKGIAKKLGSYGHLAACGTRADATENALRWLTGGHVTRVPSADYEWLSIAAEVTGKDGVQLVINLLNEGSLVAFGKSETRIFHYPKKKKKKEKCVTNRGTYPHGRLFPVIGVEQRKGFRFLVLRDAWGLVPDAVLEPDPKYGQCRLFEVPVESIPLEFDTMVVSRFPDSMKAHVYKESKRLIHIKPPTVPWITEILHQETKDINRPARFLIRVSPSPKGGVLAKRDKNTTVEVSDDPVELCITVSSSNSWGDCSDVIDPQPPRLYGHLCPTAATRAHLEANKLHMIDVLDSTRVRRPVAQQTDSSSITNTHLVGNSAASGVKSTLDNSAVGRDVTNDGSKADTDSEAQRLVATVGESESEFKYDFSFCCNRAWCSHSFILPPGEYILSAYSEETHEETPGVRKGMPIDKVPSQKPPPEGTGSTPRKIFKDDVGVNQGIWAHITSIGNIGLGELSTREVEASQDCLCKPVLREMKDAGLPLPEVWPFMVDHQHEAGSKGLFEVITKLRSELDKVNVQLLELKYGDTVSYVVN
eukprot:CAMPEP_0185038078 /NCGR_PEP_ID=MMETSP1103-20130426/33284_1 /TAXON_ID=36769 /ORGANISM="Paraphysomonas bandaiensis, Strain Caron Lab Isolate" /LENGTH=855 /DNA_ID=CAMNT_0027576349 /DNA_START=137 /DNA_END=2704 /DNA_ORIENTATION=-